MGKGLDDIEALRSVSEQTILLRLARKLFTKEGTSSLIANYIDALNDKPTNWLRLRNTREQLIVALYAEALFH